MNSKKRHEKRLCDLLGFQGKPIKSRRRSTVHKRIKKESLCIKDT